MTNAFGRPTTLPRPERQSIGAVPGAGPGTGAAVRDRVLADRHLDPETRQERYNAMVERLNKDSME